MGGSLSGAFRRQIEPILAVRLCCSLQYRVRAGFEWRYRKQRPPVVRNPRRYCGQQRRSSCRRAPFVFATPYGLLNSKPTPGEALDLPQFRKRLRQSDHQYARQPDLGFRRIDCPPRESGRRRGGPRGGGFGGGRPGGGGGGGGGRGGGLFGGATSNRRYNVIASVEIRNLLNSVNPSAPVGTLGSPFFGEAQGITGGFGGGGGGAAQSANRRLEMQLRFSF